MDEPSGFPVELEREIFETTALMHPNAIPSLLRVAHRVLTWIEPLLYRVVRVDNYPPYSDIAAAVLSAAKSKPPGFLHTAVRHLFLDSSATWSQDDATQVLNLCTGIVNLAAIGRFSNPTLLPFLAHIQVQRLAVCLDDLFGGYRSIDMAHSLFASITHLDIFDTVNCEETCMQICAHLPRLPALTHLCLNNEVPWDTIAGLLADCARLELLVELWPYTRARLAYPWAQNAPVRDVRFVVGLYRDYWADWENGAWGRTDFWVLAERFVARKRSGEIEAGYYWLDQTPLTTAQEQEHQESLSP
ncbi:hypothetical protein C8R44DRAFT_821313 [Mycena epipterygia]|nr:hypothetical protein C8R44DRAFT_821313 [Mycena epipterygia]